ncbi:MAG: MarR family winged helix-turn-helix transcriptional regulator, partial [Candidatus Hydrogenedentes bacterium]|nr:MarR family winged helix-turn-helix transcriptional regulator [Candidatus Hydrogenedentota bacterium]
EPARLRIAMVLSGIDVADFNFLLTALGLTRGNLSSHMDRLEKAGYVAIEKGYNGKIPRTEYRLTEGGRTALKGYWSTLDGIRSNPLNPNDTGRDANQAGSEDSVASPRVNEM